MISPEVALDTDWGPLIDGGDMYNAVRILQRGLRPRFVYFAMARSAFEDEHAPMVKIGTTVRPDERLQQVRSTLSRGPGWLSDDAVDSFEYLGMIPGDEELERQLHLAFSPHRVSGEWFWLDPIDAAIDILLCSFCVCPTCLLVDSQGKALS